MSLSTSGHNSEQPGKTMTSRMQSQAHLFVLRKVAKPDM
jgi:hypothetical protein